MSDYDGTIYFKHWLPDQPELGNPGLTEAKNVLPYEGRYISYAPAVAYGAALPYKALAARRIVGIASGDPSGFVYVGTIGLTAGSTAGHIYSLDDQFQTANASSAASWSDVTPSAYAASSAMSIAQYKEFVIVANGVGSPVYRTFNSASAMVTLGSTVGTAPSAHCVGVIGQFVVLGNLYPTLVENYTIQWSGIDAPTSWPTPNSATAIAQQSSRQYMDAQMGAVVGIAQGDKWGLVLQSGGIVRMTYIGGSAVFDFANIYRGPGPLAQKAWVQIESFVYFVSAAGFFVCDGVTTQPIGEGEVDQYFLTNLDRTQLASVFCGVDYTRNLIFWALPKSTDATAGQPEELVVYNYIDKAWSHVFETLRTFILGGESSAHSRPLEAISSADKRAHFTGTPGTAILTTGELEPNAGGFATVQGVKPLVDQTLNGITVAMGTRNDRSSSVSYTTEQTANSRSGFANFRTAAKYHRARLTITGTFNAAQGLEYQAVPDGYT